MTLNIYQQYIIYLQFFYNKKAPKLLFKSFSNISSDILKVQDSEKHCTIEIKPQLSFTDLVSILNKISPVFIKDVSSFAKIARGQSKKYHNWQLLSIEISWENLIE